MKLTPRQDKVLAFIKDFMEEKGYPPTRADIARGLGFKSPNASEDHLRVLARKGAIEIIPNRSRGLRILADQGLPIVGEVAAGSPILAREHIEDYAELPPGLFRPRADFLLTVRGESMVEAGILDGDLLAVHKTPEAKNGDIVVARIEDEVTVKRLQRQKGSPLVTLLPENRDYKPIKVNLRTQDFAIEGISVGLVRC